MLRFLRLAVAVLVAGTAATTTASPSTQPSTEANAQPTFEYFLSAYLDHLQRKQFNEAAEAAKKIQGSVPDTRIAQGLSKLLQAPIAAGRRKDDEAKRLLADAETMVAGAPEVLMVAMPAFTLAGRKDFAGMMLDRSIARTPDLVRDLPVELVWDLLRDTGEGNTIVDDRRIALAEIGFGGNEGDYLSADAIRILLERQSLDRARSLIRFIDSPPVVEDLLIQRRYAPVWADLAAQAGPGLANSRRNVVQNALQDRAAKPDSAEALANLINAYRYARQWDEAKALRAQLPTTAAALAKADEHTGWAVNNLALTLQDEGKGAEADQVFASLNEALPANGWRVSMLINRIELQVINGSYSQALPLIALAEKEPKSPYAVQLLRRLRYCALSKLGRTAEAVPLRAQVLSHAKDALAPTIDGLICAGDLDEAEQIALANLEDPKFQDDFVRSLQRVRLTSVDPSTWERWSLLRKRPAIEAAFQRLGRDMPADLLVTSH